MIFADNYMRLADRFEQRKNNCYLFIGKSDNNLLFKIVFFRNKKQLYIVFAFLNRNQLSIKSSNNAIKNNNKFSKMFILADKTQFIINEFR